MELETLQAFIDADNPDELIAAIQSDVKPLFDMVKYKDYNPENHKVILDKIDRRDKWVFVPNGETNTDGSPKTIKQKVKVARLAVPYQRIIVTRAVQFLTGGKVEIKDDAKDGTPQKKLADAVRQMWRKNKLQFRNSKIAKTMMSQMECAELWYRVADPKTGKETMRMNILSPLLGFTLYPIFDVTNNMIGFACLYETDNDSAEREQHFDLYTDDFKYEFVSQQAGTWELSETTDLPYGKIPIIYYSQLETEWAIVQSLIDRYEFLISNFADINDYNGSPMLFLKGKGLTLPAKGTAGKVIESPDGEGDAKYVTWDQAPEAIKLELETLDNLIYAMTQTAPIDFENMKGLGDLSGVAFDRVLIDSHLKAKDKQNGEYGESIQRRLNFLTAAQIAIDSSYAPGEDVGIEAVFNLFSIDDVADRVNVATQGVGGTAVMSKKTAIRYIGIVDDVDEEYDEINADADASTPVEAGVIV